MFYKEIENGIFLLFGPLYDVPATVHSFYMDNKKCYNHYLNSLWTFFSIFHCLLL